MEWNSKSMVNEKHGMLKAYQTAMIMTQTMQNKHNRRIPMAAAIPIDIFCLLFVLSWV